MISTDKILEEFDIKQRLFLGGRLHSTAFNKWFVEMLTSKITQTLAEERERMRGLVKSNKKPLIHDVNWAEGYNQALDTIISSLDTPLTNK